MNPIYNQTRFQLSVPKLSVLPPDEMYEVAFAGRSNAGKSSAINAITGIGGLARTSKTPGRTQDLLFFEVQERKYLVDLPGYGYAKVPDRMRQQWYQLIEGYLSQRQGLRGVVLIMDVRHPLTEFDRQMLGWCQASEMPLHILLTKADKLSRGAAGNVLQAVRKDIAALSRTVTVQLFSAPKRLNIDEVHTRLDTWLQLGDVGA